ncbi:hypothetical protein B0H13DRAFT_1599868 [Mycena leptocephala]|nr:hypothetical protein B0H13DRAFT_1650608 [Mycena leptocephala]KAJ7926130.1 hypothetical protein B0H13DRAFT_1599868 [Mycena leptocephala]
MGRPSSHRASLGAQLCRWGLRLHHRHLQLRPTHAAHVVLWDLKIIIYFPPGSTFLLPSAILRHSNIKIDPRETRGSFTQFTPAGIFRWVYNGFKTDEKVEMSAAFSPEMRERRRQDRMNRWQESARMYRT